MSGRIIILLLTIFACLSTDARTVADFFVAAPSEAVPLLSKSNRLDMLDYFRYGSDRETANLFYGKSRILAESPTALSIQLADRSSLQIAMLANGNDTILAVVTTIAVPSKDSRLDFYNSDWQRLKRQALASPSYEQWLTKDGRKHANEFSEILPFILASAEFDSEAKTLTFTNNSDNYLAPDEYERLKVWLRPTIVYDIIGHKFKMRK